MQHAAVRRPNRDARQQLGFVAVLVGVWLIDPLGQGVGSACWGQHLVGVDEFLGIDGVGLIAVFEAHGSAIGVDDPAGIAGLGIGQAARSHQLLGSVAEQAVLPIEKVVLIENPVAPTVDLGGQIPGLGILGLLGDLGATAGPIAGVAAPFHAPLDAVAVAGQIVRIVGHRPFAAAEDFGGTRVVGDFPTLIALVISHLPGLIVLQLEEPAAIDHLQALGAAHQAELVEVLMDVVLNRPGTLAAQGCFRAEGQARCLKGRDQARRHRAGGQGADGGRVELGPHPAHGDGNQCVRGAAALVAVGGGRRRESAVAIRGNLLDGQAPTDPEGARGLLEIPLLNRLGDIAFQE